MATATAPRNDVYLSILAGRALTALADLAADGSAWNEQIQKELESGVEYCEAIRSYQPASADVGGSGAQQALRRLASHSDQEPSARLAPSDCDDVEALLRELLARSRSPEQIELLAAIKFFTKDVGYLGS